MNARRVGGWLVCLAISLLVFQQGGVGVSQPAPRPEENAARRFDEQLAPLFARHCLECHNPSDKKGGLDLSQKKTALAGGENGRAIVAGKSGESLLWQYVEGDDMPRERTPLSKAEKRLLRDWIDGGAVWGREKIDPFAYTSDRRAGYDWWSLAPVASPAVPDVKDAAWPVNDVDRFVLARLEASELKPSPQADRRTLIRRVYFDLIGLPPEPEAVEKFLADDSPGAYEKLVDDLLASPHYGERWARHWLDVIRFGESQGFERNLIRENAWRYRDWVIDAFNRDLPYDEFVRRQIAGDVLYPGDLDALLATGYHVCGTWDQVGHLEGSATMRKAARQDHMEDLVATLGQAFLGLSINCGRCHDHKFDPISQQDYYQISALLAGVTQEEKERSISASRDKKREAELRERLADAKEQLSKLQEEIRRRYARTDTGRKGPDSQGSSGLEALYTFGEKPGKTIEDRSGGAPLPLSAGKPPRFATEGPPDRLIRAIKQSGELTIEAWITPAKEQQTGPARIVTLSKDSGQRNFTLGQDGNRFDVRLRTSKTSGNGLPSLAAPDGSVKQKKTHVVYTFDRGGTGRLYVNGRRVAKRKIGGDLSNWDDGFRLGLGDEFSGDRRWDGSFHFVALYSQTLDENEVRRNFESESRDVRGGEPFEALLARATEEERSRHRDLMNARGRLERELSEVSYSGPAHVIVPRQPPVLHVLARGDFRNPQQVVAPAGLAALSRGGLSADFGLKPDAPEAQRRIKLAEWLADRRNPLTARVFVNRLWHYHFGRGIVDTPSDFGFSGGRPSHPQLLDYLASQFMEGGWKIKPMQRLIVTSAAYRQQSQVKNDRAVEMDADNRLLWRSSRGRLEGEAVRDAVLAVSGALNPKFGGPSYRDMQVNSGVMGTNAEFTDPTGEFSDRVNRRTIYRLWARSGNSPLLESLDCPDPSVMSPRRNQTITPVQSLSLLNNVLLEKCGERLAERVQREVGDDPAAQIERAYRLALSRPPSGKESELARNFVAEHGLAQFCLVLFNTNEFVFVD